MHFYVHLWISSVFVVRDEDGGNGVLLWRASKRLLEVHLP